MVTILNDQIYVRNENVGRFWLEHFKNVIYVSHLHGNAEQETCGRKDRKFSYRSSSGLLSRHTHLYHLEIMLTSGEYGSINTNIADNNKILSLHNACSFQRTYLAHIYQALRFVVCLLYTVMTFRLDIVVITITIIIILQMMKLKFKEVK